MEGTLGPTRDAAVEGILSWVEYAATGMELLAVAIIVVVEYSVVDFKNRFPISNASTARRRTCDSFILC